MTAAIRHPVALLDSAGRVVTCYAGRVVCAPIPGRLAVVHTLGGLRGMVPMSALGVTRG